MEGGDLMKKIVAGISIDPEVLEKAKVIAKSQNRFFSNYVENLLRREQADRHQYNNESSQESQKDNDNPTGRSK